MVKFDLLLSSQVPITVDPALWTVLNDLYTQVNVLVNNLNNRYGVIQSPDDNYWRINISNAGVVSTTSLGAYLP